MLSDIEPRAADESTRLRDKYLSRLREISSSIESRNQPTGVPFVVSDRGPKPAPGPPAAERSNISEGRKSSPPGEIPKAARRDTGPGDDFQYLAEEVAPKFAGALVALLREMRRVSSEDHGDLDAGIGRVDSDLRDYQGVVLALEDKVRQIDQKMTAQQELLLEQFSRLRAGVVGMEQRLSSLEGRANAQAGVIRALHEGQDQRREELRTTLERLGEFSVARATDSLPENL